MEFLFERVAQDAEKRALCHLNLYLPLHERQIEIETSFLAL